MLPCNLSCSFSSLPSPLPTHLLRLSRLLFLIAVRVCVALYFAVGEGGQQASLHRLHYCRIFRCVAVFNGGECHQSPASPAQALRAGWPGVFGLVHVPISALQVQPGGADGRHRSAEEEDLWIRRAVRSAIAFLKWRGMVVYHSRTDPTLASSRMQQWLGSSSFRRFITSFLV